MPVSLSNLERVREAIERFGLLEEGDEILVGLSGGADSVYCLLALLHLGYRVRAAHVNHGLRPTADRDEGFVRDLCSSLGVPLTVRRVRVEGRGSLEERAREVRHRVLKEEAHRIGVGKVCLAHNLSDAYETALFNLSRGTGTFGLVLPPRSGVFVRPLILLWRDEIREALRTAGVGWVEDESNYDPKFTRNFIRMNVVPRIREVFPDLPRRFRRTYLLLSRERDFLKGEIERYRRENVLHFAGLVVVRRRNDYLLSRVLSDLLKVEVGKVEGVLNLKPGRRYAVAGRSVSSYGRYVVIYSDIPHLEEREGKLVWEDLNMALVGGDLRGVKVRSRRVGERIKGKRLKALYDRAGIPMVLRNLHPVVERYGEVVWIPGVYGEGSGMRFVKICDRRPYLFDMYSFVGLNIRPY